MGNQTSLMAADHDLKLHTADDALDVMSSGLQCCIFEISSLHPDFFDLKNGIAGEILQKFSNYQYRVAIILPAGHKYSERVTELARDHRNHPFIRFNTTIDEAYAWLT